MLARIPKWLWAVGAILLYTALTREALPLGLLIRYLLPFAIVYMALQHLRSVLSGGSTKAQTPPKRTSQLETNNRVIDLCPSCGSYKQPGHRCAKNVRS